MFGVNFAFHGSKRMCYEGILEKRAHVRENEQSRAKRNLPRQPMRRHYSALSQAHTLARDHAANYSR